jgi:hypothetical protein
MPSFDFQGALASGASPQAITNYLSSQGLGNLATTYFNQQPSNTNGNFQNALNSVSQFVQNIVSPITTAAATAARGVQATPKVAAAVGDALIGNKANEASNLQQANATMAKPMLGQNTVEGNTNEQNLGQAVKAGSLIIPGAVEAGPVTPALMAIEGAGVGMAQGTGQAMTENANLQQTAKAGVQGAGIGAATGAAIPVVAGAVKNLGDMASSIPDALSEPKATPSVVDAQKVALDAIENPLSKDEQMTAVKRGQLAPSSKTGINPTTDYLPNQSKLNMAKSLQPMVESGKLQPPTTAINQESNIVNTGDEITNQSQQLRQGLQDSKAIWNENELKGRLNDVQLPDPVKNEPTLNKNAASLQKAAVSLAQDADKNPVGILDLRQNLDNYIEQNYGKNFFDKGRNADPWHQYVYAIRDELSNFAADKLPEGKLPSGVSYRDSLLNIHNLINGQDEMAAKFVREYPQGLSRFDKILKSHPMINKLGTRGIMRIAAAAVGIPLAASAVSKIVKSAVTPK